MTRSNRADVTPEEAPSPSTGVTRDGLIYDADHAVLARGMTRRGFLRVSALTGATLVVAPAMGSLVRPAASLAAVSDFSFAIIADSHTMGSKNPRMKTRLQAAIKEVNALSPAPDFVMYMGDAVHDGSPEQFKYFEDIMAALKPKTYYIPGEHDWYLDMGEYYLKNFVKGQVPYSFDHKGAHIVALNGINFNDFWSARNLTPEERMNIAGTLNDPTPGPFMLGKAQLDWLENDLSNVAKDAPILVFTHPPLYHYYRPWNFWTQDAPDAHALLKPFRNVQVFHGHVHQIVQHQMANMRFLSTVSTSWPHPYPETYQKLGLKGQMPRSNPALPFDGLGWSNNKVAGGTVTHEDILWTLKPPKV